MGLRLQTVLQPVRNEGEDLGQTLHSKTWVLIKEVLRRSCGNHTGYQSTEFVLHHAMDLF
jgi:hypothetical protein